VWPSVTNECHDCRPDVWHCISHLPKCCMLTFFLLSVYRFLEGLVSRLSYQLAELQRLANIRPPSPEGTQPLPACLIAPEALSPLLLAYDAKVERLESDNTAKAEKLTQLQATVDRRVADVERLHGELQSAMTVVAQQVCVTPREGLQVTAPRCPVTG
jgi:hypothetical protein